LPGCSSSATEKLFLVFVFFVVLVILRSLRDPILRCKQRLNDPLDPPLAK
jgi:hypothetical protein